MELEELTCLTSDYTTKPLSSRQYGIGTKTDLTFITRHIHNWASFLLWLSHFILPDAIHSSLLFPSSMLDTFWQGGLIFQCHIFLSLYTVHEVLTAIILGWFAIPSSSGSCFVRNLCYDMSVLHQSYIAWLITSSHYTSPFTMTRQWSVKGIAFSMSANLAKSGLQDPAVATGLEKVNPHLNSQEE